MFVLPFQSNQWPINGNHLLGGCFCLVAWSSNGRNPPVAKTLRPVAKKKRPFCDRVATGLRPGCDRCDHQIARLNICPRDILHPPKKGGKGHKRGVCAPDPQSSCLTLMCQKRSKKNWTLIKIALDVSIQKLPKQHGSISR